MKKFLLLLSLATGLLFALSGVALALAPTLSSYKYEDNDQNGTVERIKLMFSDTIATCTATVADFTYTANGLTGSSITGGSVSCSGVNNEVFIYFGTAGPANTTSAASAPTLAYTDEPGRQIANAGAEQVASFTTVTLGDGAKPLIKTFTYQDNDNDGKTDRFLLTFSESVVETSVLSANDLTLTNVGDFTGAAFGADATDLITGTVSTATVVLGTEATAGDTYENSGSIAISSHNSFSLRDASNNNNNTLGAQTVATFADGAAPRVKLIGMLDSDSNGKLDGIGLLYTESLTNTAAGSNGFDVTSAANHGTCDTESADPAVSDSLSLTFSCTSVYTSVGDLTLSFTANSGIQDSSGNQAPSTSWTSASSPSITDGASPVILSGTYEDQDNNGKIEKVVLTTSADNGMACTAYAQALTVGTAGTISLASAAGDTCASNGTTTFTITLATGGADNKTGGATAPVVTYTQPGNGLEDGAGNDVPTKVSLTLTDNAKQVLVSVTRNTSNGKNILTFVYSEPLTVKYDGSNAIAGGGNHASTTSLGNMTTAGTITGLGSFATAGSLVVPTTLNNVALSADSTTITITPGSGTDAYIQSGTTESQVAGNFTVVASAEDVVEDAVGLKVNTSQAVVATTTTANWDYTRPTITDAKLYDNYQNSSLTAGGTFSSSQDGKADTIVFTSSETLGTVADSATTRDDWTLSSTANEYGASLTVVYGAGSGTTYTIVFSDANIYYDLGTMNITYAASGHSFQNAAGLTIAPSTLTAKICSYGYSCTGGGVNYAVMTNQMSAPSAPVIPPPPAPSSVQAVFTKEGTVKLTWMDPVDVNLESIIIMRGKNGAVTGNVYKTIAKGKGEYIDTDVKKGDVVSYILKAKNTQGSVSSNTQEISITAGDIVPPELTKVEATDKVEIVVTFNEDMDPNSISSGDFTVTDKDRLKLIIKQASVSDNKVTLLTSPQRLGVKYTVKVENVADLGGNNIKAEKSTGELIGAAAGAFDDMASVAWAVDAVEWCRAGDLCYGREKGKFNPGSKVVRTEFAVMVAKLRLPETGRDLIPDSTSKFKDVPAAMWYAPFWNSLYNSGLARGRREGYAVPSAYMYKAEAVTLLVRWLETIDKFKKNIKDIGTDVGLGLWENPYADVNANDWYARTTAAATYYKILQGKDVDGKKYASPLEKISRSEAVVMLKRAYDLINSTK